MGDEGYGVVIIHKYLWVSASTGVSIHRHILSFGCTAFCKNLISLWLPRDRRRFLCGSPLIWWSFSSEVWRPCMYTAPGAGTWNSCGSLKKSTQVNCMRKHNNSVYGSSLPGHWTLTHVKKKKERKKIAISLIAAKWHTKRKLTIGCYLNSQSDSDLPASLSPFWCQADYSLPISFRPRQPKKAPPHRAMTSSLFWY